MAEQTTRRGGRSWFGKKEAKAGGRRTRRQDDVREALAYQEERHEELLSQIHLEAREHLDWADSTVEHACQVKADLDIDLDRKAYTAIVDLVMMVRLLQMELRDALDREEQR